MRSRNTNPHFLYYGRLGKLIIVRNWIVINNPEKKLRFGFSLSSVANNQDTIIFSKLTDRYFGLYTRGVGRR